MNRARRTFSKFWLDLLVLVIVLIVFVVPFLFIFVTAAKTRQEASLFQFSWPSQFQLFENIQAVLEYGDGRVFLAMFNSTVITVVSVILIVIF